MVMVPNHAPRPLGYTRILVRDKGLEPSRLATQGLKPRASTNFANPAYCNFGTPNRTRTCCLRCRRPTLYPNELPGYMEPQTGFEPATYGVEAHRSIHLNYWGILLFLRSLISQAFALRSSLRFLCFGCPCDSRGLWAEDLSVPVIKATFQAAKLLPTWNNQDPLAGLEPAPRPCRGVSYP